MSSLNGPTGTETRVSLKAGTARLSRVASDWGCDDGVLRNFLAQIDRLYQRQPYHNSKHGTLASSFPVTKPLVPRVCHSLIGVCAMVASCRQAHPELRKVWSKRSTARHLPHGISSGGTNSQARHAQARLSPLNSLRVPFRWLTPWVYYAEHLASLESQ